MTLKDELGVSCLKVCPVCGNIGPRLVNKCEDCQRKESEKAEAEKKERTEKLRRQMGFI